MTRSLLALVLACALPGGAAFASRAAFDAADDEVYLDGWQTGDDGGFGWGDGWILDEAAGRDYSIATSTANGDGDSDGDGDIDTGDGSWCASSAGAVASAVRRFAGPLAIGQLVAASLDADPAGGAVVFALLSPSGVDRFRFVSSPATGARLLDAGTLDLASVLPATDEGLLLQFVLTGPDSYALVLTPGGGGTPVELDRSLAGAGSLDRLVFLTSGETADPRKAFLNRIAVPEPGASAALSAFGALLLATRLRAR